MPRHPQSALLFVLVAVGYAAGYLLAAEWFSAEDQGASFFPAAGVTAAALVLVSKRQWPVVLAAAGAAELTLDLARGASLAGTVGYVLANLAQPLVGALLLMALLEVVDLRRTRDLAAFVWCAVVVGPIVGGVIGASTFVFVDGGTGWARFAFEWWSGDGLGVLVVGAAILSLVVLPAHLSRLRIAEGVALAAVAVAGTDAVFRQGGLEFVYIPIVLLIVIAFRIGTTGVAVTGALMAFAAAGATAEADEFWGSLELSPADGILYLQLALGVVFAAVLALASEIAERENVTFALATSEARRAAEHEERRQADEHAATLTVLNTFAGRLVAATTADEIANILVEAATQAFGTTHGVTALRRAGSGELEVVAARGTVPEPSPLLVEAFETAEPIWTEDAAYIPLPGRVIPYGVLALELPTDRPLGTEAEEMILTLTRQGSLALERTQLQAMADDAAADSALFARLGEVLEQATSTGQRAQAVVDALTTERAAFAAVHLLDEADELLVLSTSSPPIAGWQADRRVLAEAASRALAANAPTITEDGPLALFSVPLRARGRMLGALTAGVRLDGPRGFTLGHLQRVAGRASLALDNALLYEQERDVSHSLQMGLLGGDPASTPYTKIATAYKPATASLEIGGDWYDAFMLPDGRLGVVVGDVVGHGLEAAVAMGQLRGAVRALAPIGSPRQMMERLDDFVALLPPAHMATLAYAELDPEDGRLVYACAGHPPPLLVSATGEPRFLWDGRSTPLGAFLAADREESVDRMELGDTLVLYTDGLVERRTQGITAGLETLGEIAAGSTGDDPDRLVERILGTLLEGQTQDDDVCVLALRFISQAQRLVHSFRANPVEVARLRGVLSAWLELVDLDPARTQDAILAVSEAAANAAEHAYSFDGEGIVNVEARRIGTRVEFSVSDEGAWREPNPDGDRGRGLRIIEALMQDVAIKRGENGTEIRMTMPVEVVVAP